MSKRKYIGSFLLIGGGAVAVGAVALAARKSAAVAKKIEDAVSAPPPPPGAPQGEGVTVQLRLTGYWPFTARADERKMEGGVNDRKGKPLHTAEDYLTGRAPFVSLSGDDAIWPYGQRVDIPWTEGRKLLGRVVDTGSHFRGAGKIIRVTGYEPIDVCVASSKTEVPKLVVGTIVPGDSFDKPSKAVAQSKLAEHLAGLGKGRV